MKAQGPQLNARIRRFLFGLNLENKIVVLGHWFARKVQSLRPHAMRIHAIQIFEERSEFDDAYRVETAGEVPWWTLGNGSATDAYCVDYLPCHPGLLRKVLQEIPDLNDYTFVDLGCGKGRALIVASEFPFKSVIGVDKSTALLSIAKQNLEKVSREHPTRPPMSVIEGDIIDFEIPPGNIVIFIFNPALVPVIQAISEKICRLDRSINPNIYLIYLNPALKDIFNKLPKLESVPELSLALPISDQRYSRISITTWRLRG